MKNKELPPLTEAELKEPISSKTFFRRAQHFIETKLGGEKAALPVIYPGAESWNAWREYFERHLRWTPVVMRKIIDDAPDKPQGFTVPTLYPQHFDMSFRELEGWEPPAPKQFTKRIDHETIEELRAKYGPTWGIKVIQHEKRAKKEWKPLDWADIKPSEELKRHVNPHRVSHETPDAAE